MSPGAKWEYVKAIHERYRRADRKEKKRILDEFCRTTQCHRKHAIRRLNSAVVATGRRPRTGRPVVYRGRAMKILEETWEASGYLWSTRLKAAIPDWLAAIRKRYRTTPGEERQLLSISPAQIDRRLKDKKNLLRKRIYGGTKPGSLLKQHIPVQTEAWNVRRPGTTEIDLVSHSGPAARGHFAYTLNMTDIHTTWVERRCVLGKGEEGVCSALDDIRRELPFPLKAIDSDNGSEFINYHLYRYCQEPPRGRSKVQFTRSRPYKKDDNAHIEQKNWTHVRKLLGYHRYDTEQVVAAINDLYRNELRWFQNFFQPSVKLIKKFRIGSKTKREYRAPATPFDRVLRSKGIHPDRLQELKRLKERLDPFELSEAVDRKLQRIVSMASSPPRSTWHKPGRLVNFRNKPPSGPPHVHELESPVPALKRLVNRETLLQTF